MDEHASNWRNPVLWLVVGLPATVVVASIGMVLYASSDAIVASPDSVRRTAQVQIADLGPDEVARRERLSALLRVSDAGIDVLPVGGEFDRAAQLRVELLHPSDGAADSVRAVQPSDSGWRVVETVDTTHDWNVRLSPEDGRWRLVGRLPKGGRAVLLQPALREQP